jgi:hypothetical protein
MSEHADDPVEQFRNDLGPELEYLADTLAPAVQRLAQRVSHETVRPLHARVAAEDAQRTAAHVQTLLNAFGEKHPDWKEHEPAMLALAQKVQPTGMTEAEYLDHLYASATHERWQQERDAAIEAEVQKKTGQRGTERPATTDRPTPRHVASFDDAFQAALRGERWSDDEGEDEGAPAPPAAPARASTAKSPDAMTATHRDRAVDHRDSPTIEQAWAAAKRGERWE